MLLTTDDLVTAVRRKGQIPDASDYTDSDILAEADDVISGRLTEVIAGLSNGFYVRVLDITMVAGTARYTLPSRSVAGAVEYVTVLQSDGAERPMGRLRSSDAMYVAGTSGTPYNYTIEGDDILLYPAPPVAETIRVRYQLRRSKLVPVASCVEISAVTPLSFQVTSSDTKPANFLDTENYDIVRPTGVRGSIVLDGGMFAISTPPVPINYIFDSDVSVDDVEVGDYLCLAGETCVIQLPIELHAALANATAASILGQRGFTGGMQTLDAQAARDINAYQRMAAQRVKNAPVPFINRGSMLRLRGR